jgi:Spy/CpxP family protein refolding chaperone
LSVSRFLGTAAFVASLAVPVTALAQQAPPPAAATFAPGARAHHGHRHGGFRQALRSLSLSASQQTQIDQAFAQSRQTNRNADQATRKANRRQLRTRIEAILTPAQRAQLKATLHRNRRPA